MEDFYDAWSIHAIFLCLSLLLISKILMNLLFILAQQQQQMLVNARSSTTLAEKLPGLQGQTCQFISASGTNHNEGTGYFKTDLDRIL